MEILETIPVGDVPEGAMRRTTGGVWVSLLQRMLAAHSRGEVVPVRLENQKELDRLRNGVQAGVRKAGYLLRPSIVSTGDEGLTVYLCLEPREPSPSPDGAERDEIGRRRRR
jgi:hypothetical protein